jgi:hypothetical protein
LAHDEEGIFTIKEPDDVVCEIRTITASMYPEWASMDIPKLVADVAAIFAGTFPGYRQCTTGYHDLSHALDVALATVRLVHGMHVSGISISRQGGECVLFAALFHDIGFIQEAWDTEGTGAKYATTHVQRGITFVDKYLSNRDIEVDATLCARIIRFTDLTPEHSPETGEQEPDLLGKVLASADLMAQMADRDYLSKLPLLYAEFVEGGIGGFVDEYDMVRNTLGFAEFVRSRLRGPLGNLNPLVRHHFRVRWQVNRDLYAMHFERNMVNLAEILRKWGPEYRTALRGDNRR